MNSFIDSHNLAVTTLQNDYLSMVDMSRGRKQLVRRIRQSQHCDNSSGGSNSQDPSGWGNSGSGGSTGETTTTNEKRQRTMNKTNSIKTTSQNVHKQYEKESYVWRSLHMELPTRKHKRE